MADVEAADGVGMEDDDGADVEGVDAKDVGGPSTASASLPCTWQSCTLSQCRLHFRTHSFVQCCWLGSAIVALFEISDIASAT